MVTNVVNGTLKWYSLVLMLLGALAMLVLIVVVYNAERRIPVQYSKRVVGRKMYGGQSTHLPMKLNMAGVMPIIFAQSIASLPPTFAALFGKTGGWFLKLFDTDTVNYAVIYFLLILFFSYFYATIQFNPLRSRITSRKTAGSSPGTAPASPPASSRRRCSIRLRSLAPSISESSP
jgi:preprotein translocase subunit SecY